MHTSPEFATSRDGSRIAFWRFGSGPALLVIGGALSDHAGYVPLAEALSLTCTTIIWDRRERGHSRPPASPYAPEREVEDVAALLTMCDEPVTVYGHSSGAALALRAAAAGLPFARLVLGDPPYSPHTPEAETLRAEHAQQADTLRALLADDDRAGAVRFFLSGFGLSSEELDGLMASPAGEGMSALATTLPHDYALLGDGLVPLGMAELVQVPTLVLAAEGDDLAARQLCAALPDARLTGMVAPLLALAVEDYAPEILQFMRA